MLYSGIDLHKRTLAIHTVDAAGTLVRKADLPTNRDAVSAYFATLDGPHRVVCECTSMWYWVRDLLVPQEIDLRLAHATYLKAISDAKVKTDAVAAATMAQRLRVELIPEAHMIRDGYREIRDGLRSRLVMVSRALQCQRGSARCSSSTTWPRLPRCPSCRVCACATSTHAVAWCPVRTTRAARRGTNARATAIATSSSRFIMRLSAPCRTCQQ